jgi:CheY-like chemotaxis protein
LSLTKHLVEINGGMIGADSEVGKGSTFWILMPLLDHSAVATAAPDYSPSVANALSRIRLDGLNVLVVDDNVATCEVLRVLIKSVGGNPYVAESVANAKEILKTTSLDTILLDLAMPGESGVELITYIRRECGAPLNEVPVIVVSACVFGEDRKQASDRGASSFIPKPFQPFEVLEKIRELTAASVLTASHTALPIVRL